MLENWALELVFLRFGTFYVKLSGLVFPWEKNVDYKLLSVSPHPLEILVGHLEILYFIQILKYLFLFLNFVWVFLPAYMSV